jgi:hypothetical protein
MRHLFLLITTLLAGHAFAQHEERIEALHEAEQDTLSLSQAFKKGKTTGHFRYFFMATDNAKGLTDYYANAIGGGLKFETAPFRRFQFGVGGFFIYNLRSSNLAEEDPLTQQHNRYELSLFDLEDPENKADIDRLEELYLKYTNKGATITAGKQLINTPFINPQDSRMRPTEVEGVFAEVKAGHKWQFEGGWIYNISPRSTVEWYPVAKSIGINSQGVTPDGLPGNYRDHLSSKGIGLAGLTYKPFERLSIKAYNQFADNLFNTVLIQAEYQKPLSSSKVKAALQYIRQDAINSGGNEDPLKTYFDKRNKVNVLGAKLGLQKGHWETTLNYTRIAKTGRFTMPREWGTEPLFTYLSRERNEGFGDVDAFMANVRGTLPHYHLRLELGYGHYYLPDVENKVLNKYGLPSYRHLKAMADYEFKGPLEGLDIAMLYVHKGQLGQKLTDPKYIFNKVGMSSFNIIMNYHF